MNALEASVDLLARESAFSGVVRMDRDGEILVAKAYGLAHRACRVPNTTETQFGIASATKGLTALTVVSLIQDGAVDLSTTARSVLGDDLPLIAADVTVEHLLAHRSGIGDHVDEEADGYDVNDYILPVGAHEVATSEDYLRVLDGHPTQFAAGERFSYCNSGYAVLALIAERVGGLAFHELVAQRVCGPAGMHRTAFLRSDELPGGAALGYLDVESDRTNVFHLPVRGSGDGGAYATVADFTALWTALFAGAIVTAEWVAEMIRPHSDVPAEAERYGLGFWLDATGDRVMLEGLDAGVSCRSVHDPDTRTTSTVLSNTTEGAWPMTRLLDEHLGF